MSNDTPTAPHRLTGEGLRLPIAAAPQFVALTSDFLERGEVFLVQQRG